MTLGCIVYVVEEKVLKEKLGIPRRPAMAYFQFIKERNKNRPENVPVTEFVSLVAKEWRQLSEDEKKIYYQRQESDVSEYKKRMKDFLEALSESRLKVYNLLKIHKKIFDQELNAHLIPSELSAAYQKLPRTPCLTPSALFMKEFYASGNKEPLAKAWEAYNSLSEDEKKVIRKKQP